MLTLDRIKIVAPLGSVTAIRQNVFETKTKDGTVISMSYTQTSPSKLYVELDYKEKETVIEFTGKLLGEHYPELINHRKYLARNISGNLTIEKNVRTKAYKRRLTIYDKEKELRRADNREFIASLTDPESLLSYFKSKIRFEYNLNSKQSIRQVLNIRDTTINAILDSDVNPIRDFINDVVSEDAEADSTCLTWTDRKNLAMLRDCDMDLSKVEAEIRTYASKCSHLSQIIKPYKELWSRLNVKKSEFKANLLGLLLETTIIFPLLLVW